MEEQQNAALLERANSAESVGEQRRNANAKAFKVAGLTLLACLLLAGQGLTAYFILGQRDHITALEQGQENLKNQLSRRVSSAPMKMHVPMGAMPLMTGLTDDETPKQVPLMRTLPVSFVKEGSGLVDEGNRQFPGKMRQPMPSLHLLTELGDEKTKESEGTEIPETEVETKCRLESQHQVRPGFFRPKCDKDGNYLPMQCWSSTGFCWCVDKNGKEIEHTLTRGRPHCGGVNDQLED